MVMSVLAIGVTRQTMARACVLALAGLTLAACAGGPRPSGGEGQPTSRYTGYKVGKPYQVRGVWYYPKEQPRYDEIGMASWYGDQFHNHYTADGEVFDMNLPSAAHKTLPLPSLVEVTNLANGRKVLVRVNDRGPFVDGRVIDMSKAGAEALGFVASGLTRVRVRYVGQAPDPPTQVASSAASPSTGRLAAAPDQRASAGRSARSPEDRPVQTAATTPVPGRRPSQQTTVSPAPLPDVDSLLAGGGSASYELLAGPFATEAAAKGFAANLSVSGLPEVQPVDRQGLTLYRVVVHGLAGPDEASAARRQAIALGVRDPVILAGS